VALHETSTATVAQLPGSTSSIDVATQLSAAQVSAGLLGSAPSSSEAAPVSSAGVGMQDMIDAIRATVEIATRQGATQARIALQPEELGDIRIHLSQTSEGLLARVTADTPAAAQALAQGRAELHQSLSSLGVSLLRLDIGSSGQPHSGGREAGFAGDSGRPGGSGASTETDEEQTSEIATAGEGSLQATVSGGLVDVLA
jgi:flagellar hook-length control protein FliK